jgi:hypothetical protein
MLRRLEGRSLGEFVDRGRRKLLAAAERAGVAGRSGYPTDEELLGRTEPAAAVVSEVCAIMRSSVFFPAFREPESTAATLEKRFRDRREAILKRANQIADGRFSLLGFIELEYGSGMVPDWHFEPRAMRHSPLVHWSRIGETDPCETGDKKIIWELNRHQYFCDLGQAYWYTGDERYASVFAEHVEDWIEKNPPKLGVNWVSALEISFRSISWIWAIHFFRNSPALTDELLLKMVKGLYLNAAHIRSHLSTYTSPNTHLTGEALGIYVIGSYFSGILKEAPKWKAAGYSILLSALDDQVREDGGHIEQSVHYHRYTTDLYLFLYLLRRSSGEPVDARHREKLLKMLKFIQHLTGPDGFVPLIGDDDGGRLHYFEMLDNRDHRPTLAVGAAFFQDPELKFTSGEPSPELLWLLGPKGVATYDEIPGRASPVVSASFPKTGIYTKRVGSGRRSSFIVFDAGEHGFLNGAHAHADALSFVLWVDGQPVFIDPGTYSYTGDAGERERLRSTGSHNCITVDGGSSAVPGGPFSWLTKPRAWVNCYDPEGPAARIRGGHDGFARLGVTYQREISFADEGIILIDDQLCSAAVRNFDLNLILDPEVFAVVDGPRSVRIKSRDGNRDLLTIVSELAGEGKFEALGWSIEAFDISRKYGSLTPSSKLKFTVTGSGSVSIRTRMNKPGIEEMGECAGSTE